VHDNTTKGRYPSSLNVLYVQRVSDNSTNEGSKQVIT